MKTLISTLVIFVFCALTVPVNAGVKEVGTVSYVEGKQVGVDSDASLSVNPGTRLEIFNYDGKKVATVGVENKNGSEMVCKLIRGTDDIRPGYTVKTRNPLQGAVFIEANSFPVDVKPNPEFTRVTGEESDKDVPRGMSFSIGGIVSLDPKIGTKQTLLSKILRIPMYQISTSYLDLGVFKAWEIINVGPVLRLEVVPEKFRFEIAGGAGIGLGMTKIKWARDTTWIYGDPIEVNSGEAEFAAVYTYRASAGIHYQLTRPLGIFVRGGYYGFSFEEPLETERPDEAGYNSGYDIREEWWECTLGEKGGIFIQAGLQYWTRL